MTSRTKKKRAAKTPQPLGMLEPWTPGQIAQATHLAAISYAREPDPVDDPEALAELQRHRVGLIDLLARKVEELTKGRRGGEDRERAARVRDHIATLRGKYPKLKAKELRARADAAIVGYLSEGAWANLVSIVTPPRSKGRAR